MTECRPSALRHFPNPITGGSEFYPNLATVNYALSFFKSYHGHIPSPAIHLSSYPSWYVPLLVLGARVMLRYIIHKYQEQWHRTERCEADYCVENHLRVKVRVVYKMVKVKGLEDRRLYLLYLACRDRYFYTVPPPRHLGLNDHSDLLSSSPMFPLMCLYAGSLLSSALSSSPWASSASDVILPETK